MFKPLLRKPVMLMSAAGVFSVLAAEMFQQQVAAQQQVNPQQQNIRQQQPAPSRPLDAAVEDVNPLAVSLRDTQIDLRVPAGFQNVYTVPGRNDLLMRSSGALHAVFPQSTYALTRDGQVALVPPGTVFHIGMPRSPLDTSFGPEGSSDPGVNQMLHASTAPPSARLNAYIPPQYADADMFNHAHAPAPQQNATNSSAGPTIATNDEYRARRIQQLLEHATAAVLNPRENHGEDHDENHRVNQSPEDR